MKKINSHKFSTFNESQLHRDMKDYYKKKYSGELEKEIDGKVIDVVTKDYLIEVQTKNYSQIKEKLIFLSKKYKIRLVTPIAYELIISYTTNNKKRKSPINRNIFHIFNDLVYFPDLLKIQNIILDVPLVKIEEKREPHPFKKTKWIIKDRQLVEIYKIITISNLDDILSLIPPSLPNQFTVKDFGELTFLSLRLARKVVYSLRKIDLIEKIAIKNRFSLYKFKNNS